MDEFMHNHNELNTVRYFVNFINSLVLLLSIQEHQLWVGGWVGGWGGGLKDEVMPMTF